MKCIPSKGKYQNDLSLQSQNHKEFIQSHLSQLKKILVKKFCLND